MGPVTHTQTQTVMESTEYFSNLNVHQEKPQHAVDTGEDPDPSNYPLGPGYCAHCLSLHWMADSYVPAGKEEVRLTVGVDILIFGINLNSCS